MFIWRHFEYICWLEKMHSCLDFKQLCRPKMWVSYSDVWRVSLLSRIFPGAPSAGSVPAGPLSLWGQTVPGLCHQPEWPELLWGLQWGTQTVQVLSRWVCDERGPVNASQLKYIQGICFFKLYLYVISDSIRCYSAYPALFSWLWIFTDLRLFAKFLLELHQLLVHKF